MWSHTFKKNLWCVCHRMCVECCYSELMPHSAPSSHPASTMTTSTVALSPSSVSLSMFSHCLYRHTWGQVLKRDSSSRITVLESLGFDHIKSSLSFEYFLPFKRNNFNIDRFLLFQHLINSALLHITIHKLI